MIQYFTDRINSIYTDNGGAGDKILPIIAFDPGIVTLPRRKVFLKCGMTIFLIIAPVTGNTMCLSGV
ncbi:MAG: hypothetical protein WCI71_08705 [Bacteroidota bacterium]